MSRTLVRSCAKPPGPQGEPTHELDEPSTVLLFRPSCAGKSTLGRAVAGRLSRCAFIEVDALRYMVRGGLVAYSRGTPPWEQPEEYKRQRRLGVENAVRLARGFAAAGELSGQMCG